MVGAPAQDGAALRARIESLKAALAEKESNRREALDELRSSETAISEASRTIRALEAQASEARQGVSELQSRSRKLEGSIAAHKDALARLLAARAAERTRGGAPDLLRVVLGSEHPNDVARRLVYLAALSRAAADALESHRAARTDLEVVRSRLEERSREILALEARARSERERLLAERRGRRQVLERIGAELRSSQARLRTLSEEERKLGRIVTEVGRLAADMPVPVAAGAAFSSLRGRLVRPVRELLARIAPGTSRSGARKGVFLRAREGEPVRAVAAGRVVYADWMRGLGNLLIVDHGEAYFSIYGNNEALLKQPGDAVSAGETVATVGASGGSEESGLYFELRHLGRSFDPMQWLPRQ